ncbi:MAG: PAS domain S-box protein [Acidobacteriia bacterium]|nr:PAS domain S-box protein [Terriglobia bacterium]
MARLKALFDCHILDTPREEVFDQVTNLAAYLCGTPISFIGFIDATRQWFKSAVGWDASEIPREHSFCYQTLRERSLLLIEDTTKDRRFAGNPLVAHGGIRFYAGAPLLTLEGYALGTLCVMDTVPRALPDGHKNALRALANLVAAQLAARRAVPRTLTSSQVNRNALLFDQNVAGFYRSEADGRLLDCNTTFARILGYSSREEVLQCHASDLYFSPNDRESFLRKLKEQKSLFNVDCLLRKKDGTPVWVLENVFAALDTRGEVTMLEGTMVDVSERKRTDQALRDSQERLQGIIGSAMDAIITVDGDQRIVVFNHAAEEIFRCPASDAVGQPLDKYIPARFREAHRQHIQDFGRTGLSVRSMYSPGTLWGIRSSGEEFPAEATISQTTTANEKLYTVILRDISMRKRVEDELRQAQKMEALGQLAGGIAHEFNNYLSIILGYSDLLETKAGENETLRREVAEIKNATQKAASLTRQLLAFSRKQVVESRALDLNAAIWETHKLLRRLIPANVDLIPVLHPDLGRVKGDPAQIQQILINLVINARDSMPQGGKVTIETSEVELDEEFASRHSEVQPGKYIMLSVGDTGQGMDADTASHIFEPFFTTKTQGKGTGLGLSTIYGIVKQSGGHVTVASVLGRGTTLRVYLPVLAASDQDTTVDGRSELVQPGIGTILVAEDDSALRRLIRITLECKGYKVLEAKDGQEALSICEGYPGPIGLVVTDLVMPRVTGLQLKEKAVALRPETKFLLISGYADDSVNKFGELATNADFLEKPFLPDELTAKVYELLNADADEPQAEVRSEGFRHMGT